MLSASERIPELKQLIDQRNYFVIHAPRQVGKTTAMLTLAQELTAQVTEFLAKDVTIPITVELINQAKEILIKRQDTHLDSLAERFREDRVRADGYLFALWGFDIRNGIKSMARSQTRSFSRRLKALG